MIQMYEAASNSKPFKFVLHHVFLASTCFYDLSFKNQFHKSEFSQFIPEPFQYKEDYALGEILHHICKKTVAVIKSQKTHFKFQYYLSFITYLTHNTNS